MTYVTDDVAYHLKLSTFRWLSCGPRRLPPSPAPPHLLDLGGDPKSSVTDLITAGKECWILHQRIDRVRV